jgi:hypothetical protein
MYLILTGPSTNRTLVEKKRCAEFTVCAPAWNPFPTGRVVAYFIPFIPHSMLHLPSSFPFFRSFFLRSSITVLPSSNIVDLFFFLIISGEQLWPVRHSFVAAFATVVIPTHLYWYSSTVHSPPLPVISLSNHHSINSVFSDCLASFIPSPSKIN